MRRVWLRCWRRRASSSVFIVRFELPTRRRKPEGLRCTNRLRGTTIRRAGSGAPPGPASSMRWIEASSGGSSESSMISATNRSTTSSCSSGMPVTSRVRSLTPRTSVPPRVLAKAAISSASAFRSGPRIFLPARTTSLSSSDSSSLRRIRSSRSGADSGILGLSLPGGAFRCGGVVEVVPAGVGEVGAVRRCSLAGAGPEPGVVGFRAVFLGGIALTRSTLVSGRTYNLASSNRYSHQ